MSFGAADGSLSHTIAASRRPIHTLKERTSVTSMPTTLRTCSPPTLRPGTRGRDARPKRVALPLAELRPAPRCSFKSRRLDLVPRRPRDEPEPDDGLSATTHDFGDLPGHNAAECYAILLFQTRERIRCHAEGRDIRKQCRTRKCREGQLTFVLRIVMAFTSPSLAATVTKIRHDVCHPYGCIGRLERFICRCRN